jgi:hypothetical protein
VNAFEVRRISLEGLADLQREFTGRGKHERLRALLAEVKAVEDGQRERCRLTGSRLGNAENVAALEQWRDRRGLDGGRILVPDVLQCLQNRVAQSEIAECDGGRFGLGRSWGRHPLTLVAGAAPGIHYSG